MDAINSQRHHHGATKLKITGHAKKRKFLKGMRIIYNDSSISSQITMNLFLKYIYRNKISIEIYYRMNYLDLLPNDITKIIIEKYKICI